ncbi:DNA cytosine methyltransferase [Microbacterium sp. NPDC007973]|uniref:DNA cytosine methyltransferase n=1 Tax=Microbacterium sp. NPDC007973 TaxID=3364182 RepID=UPI0036E8E7B7
MAPATLAYSGELFAGTGMLGRAVSVVFGTRPRWFCEFDAAPSKVLAHHYPDVPNYGDVTKVDFTTVPHTHVRAGGFPCQDVSVSGARAGLRSGTRSGLWSEFARSIAEDRPDWVVIENVGGLLSAEAASGDGTALEPCPWCVGDDDDEPRLRALGAVLADLAALGFDAEWTSIRASDVGAPHGRLRVFILAWPKERTRTGDPVRPRVSAPGQGVVTLLPTPTVVMNDGESVESWSARRERVKATGANGNGMGMPLPIAVQLLPTPTVGSSSPAAHGQISGDFRARMDAVIGEVTMMPAPRTSRGGSSTETMYGLGAERDDEGDRQGNVTGEVSSWGPYAAAIARWEFVMGRPAPAPMRMDGKGGKGRLNPELTEWMMGWPAGWVTDAAVGLSRAEQLKACGNGVVLQQAIAALRMLLERPGVPRIEWEVAA